MNGPHLTTATPKRGPHPLTITPTMGPPPLRGANIGCADVPTAPVRGGGGAGGAR